MAKRSTKVPISIVLLSFAVVGFVALVSAQAAKAAPCTPAGDSGVAAGDTEDSGIHGFRATVQIVDWNDPACDAVRSIYVTKDAFNRIELGWNYRKSANPESRVFWAARVQNIYVFEGIQQYQPNGGTDKSFKIENANGDYRWPLYYEGIFIDNPQMAFAHGDGTMAGSEREYLNGDSLRAHFEGMQICQNSCNGYSNPANQVERRNINPGSWRWCKIDNREFRVRDEPC